MFFPPCPSLDMEFIFKPWPYIAMLFIIHANALTNIHKHTYDNLSGFTEISQSLPF